MPIHASADVDSSARVDPTANVWHLAQIRERAVVGMDSVVGRGAYVGSGVVLGARCKLQNLAQVYEPARLADGVFVGPGAILTNDRYPRAITADGDLARADDWELLPIRIEHGASIGAGAVVVAGCDVGLYATVGAGAIVTRTVPGHALVAGNPARRIGWVCACGARLNDGHGDPAPAEIERYATNPELSCERCGRRYRYEADEDTLREVAR